MGQRPQLSSAAVSRWDRPVRSAGKEGSISLSQFLLSSPVADSYLFGPGGNPARADEPWFVLTGHTLMVGGLGRTELAASVEAAAVRAANAGLLAIPDLSTAAQEKRA